MKLFRIIDLKYKQLEMVRSGLELGTQWHKMTWNDANSHQHCKYGQLVNIDTSKDNIYSKAKTHSNKTCTTGRKGSVVSSVSNISNIDKN